jgi:inorganic pyrophosphatase
MVLDAITTYRALKGDSKMESRNLIRLPPFDKASGALNIIVETPKNGRIKYKYNEKYAMFQLDKTLPYGFSFPFEFGFVPSTIGGDGDPLDVLVLSDEATFPGCLVLGQVLGVLQAEQREGKQVNRNDRVVAIPVSVKTQEPMIPLKTLDRALISDITTFFISYNEAQGKRFKSLGFGSRQRALELVEEARKRASKKRSNRY